MPPPQLYLERFHLSFRLPAPLQLCWLVLTINNQESPEKRARKDRLDQLCLWAWLWGRVLIAWIDVGILNLKVGITLCIRGILDSTKEGVNWMWACMHSSLAVPDYECDMTPLWWLQHEAVFTRCLLQELERKLRQESSLQLWPDVTWLHHGLLLTLLPALQWLWFFFVSPHWLLAHLVNLSQVLWLACNAFSVCEPNHSPSSIHVSVKDCRTCDISVFFP